MSAPPALLAFGLAACVAACIALVVYGALAALELASVRWRARRARLATLRRPALRR